MRRLFLVELADDRMCSAGIPGILVSDVCCPNSCGSCGGEDLDALEGMRLTSTLCSLRDVAAYAVLFLQSASHIFTSVAAPRRAFLS